MKVVENGTIYHLEKPEDFNRDTMVMRKIQVVLLQQ